MDKQRIALTWGDAGENHVGMEMIGQLQEKGTGFTLEDLSDIKDLMENKLKLKCELVNFGRNAGVLVIRKFLRDDIHKAIYIELIKCPWEIKWLSSKH